VERERAVDPGARHENLSGGRFANGTKIILWFCNGQGNQQWSPRS
jgi:hypothetical protein